MDSHPAWSDGIDVPQTEDPAINEVLSAVAQLAQRPVGEHADVFSEAHDVLRRGLDRPGSERGASAPNPPV